jgi:hypothetical protein
MAKRFMRSIVCYDLAILAVSHTLFHTLPLTENSTRCATCGNHVILFGFALSLHGREPHYRLVYPQFQI